MHSSSGGRPKHARDRDEEQFILRLPEALSEQMRLGLGSKSKRDAAGSEVKFGVHFTSERDAYFLLNGTRYPAVLCDLPCILETHKTADKRTYYKSGDVHQVLVVRMPDEAAPAVENAAIPYMLPNGVTQSGKRAAERFHVPPTVFSADQVESVESQMKFVVDNKINFNRKKTETTPAATDDSEDVIIEADAVDTAETAPSAVDNAAPSPAPSTLFPTSPFPAAAQSPAPGTAPGTPAAFTPGPMASPSPAPTTPVPLTPIPLTPVVDAEDDEDDDMLAGMLAEEMLESGGDTAEREAEQARLRIERTTLDGKIDKMKGEIRVVQERAGKAPNPVLKMRILAKIPELEASLKELESARAALN